ncbi:MAG TPA: hypothetical protein VD905_17125, partial [Flavobacteriales bacterium]|nr:hypothetical protein [Flavobacteriales bacterium]
ESDEIVALVVAWNVMISKMGPLTTAAVTCYRIFVNAKTGQIYSISGVSTGDIVDQYFRPKSMRQHSDCN